MVREKAAETLSEEDSIRSDMVGLSIECDNRKAMSECNMGPRERELNRKLEDMKVIRQAYHGNVFVGNHCEIVLKNYELLCSVIADKQEHHKKFTCIFQIFSELCPFLFIKSRFLTNHEIRLVEKLCTDFGKGFPVLFPDKNITRKIHELIFNVPLFYAGLEQVECYLKKRVRACMHRSIAN